MRLLVLIFPAFERFEMNTIVNLRLLIVVALVVLAVPSGHTQDGTSNTILFQTRVETPEGDPIPNGSYPVRFSIYATENDTSTLWSETQPLVEVTDGTSNTIIFGETPPPSNLFDQHDNLWLEVAIDRDNDGFDPEDIFNPRTPLHAVPFALYAKDSGSLGGVPAEEYAKTADVTAELEALESSVNSAQDAQDTAIASKADAVDVYTKAEVYTKSEVDAQQAAQDAAIDGKADAAAVQSQQDAQDTAIAGKADADSVFLWEEATSGPVLAQANRGYVTTADSQVSITLPSSASLDVGDVVRVSGTGTGGWRIGQGAGQQTLTQGIAAPRYLDDWKTSETSRIWYTIGCSSDGKTVLAADGGGPGPVFRSTDGGETWDQVYSNGFWRAVALSADGSRMAAAGAGPGVLVVSDDGGTTWNIRDDVRAWGDVAMSSDGSILAAVVRFGGLIYVSDDGGATWEPRDSGREWNSIAMSADGSRMIACAGPGFIYVSDDSGETWTPRNNSGDYRAVASSADGQKLAAVAYGGQIHISTDGGLNWSSFESTRNWTNIAMSADGSILAATVFGGQVYVSTDSGLDWKALESNRNWRAAALSSDGGKLFALGENTLIYRTDRNPSFIGQPTTSGVTGAIIGRQYSAIELQYAGNGFFMPLGSIGDIDVR
ncbi:MAG: hypothetical protein RLZZ303_518 [Candidatus Hydrogenedentota bacterium]|jgi:hypothetical protein